ncbi:hypothetical protein C8R44DRAFT_737000 [Mycena epipterygia]|nr:hypothetical protein C8R44DRAFT_737000 [Mycena epipterygia]
MPAKVVILAQFDHGYYIRGTLTRLTDVVAWLKSLWIRFDHGYYIRETLKRLTDVVAWLKALWIHFDHGYYIHETLKRLTDVLAWLKSLWIHVFWLASELGGSVWFYHGYYIRETLKWLADVFARFKAWWICVSVKQVTDQKSMPLLPRWGGKVVILAQFGHGYYIRGTSKCLTGFMD